MLYLLTAAQVFLMRYTALDCRAERMALKDEKFFSCLHSYGAQTALLCNAEESYISYRKLFLTLTCATAIHHSMMRALWAGLECGQWGELGSVEGYRKAEEELGDEAGEEVAGLGEVGQRRDVMTRLVMALNWEMVARTVGARFRFSFLSRWDQTQPRQSKGNTLTNSS